MCDPVSIGIGMAVAQGGASAMQAKAEANYQNAVAKQQYQVAKRNAERNNQIATQQYNNQLRIVQEKDKAKKKDYEAQIKAHEEAMNANIRQSDMNALSANLAATEVALKKKNANAEAAFKTQEALTTMIKAQGQMLSTGNVGQSFLLQTMDAERTLGFTSAQIDELMYNQNAGFGIELAGVGADYLSAEWASYNALPGTPQAQQAELLPYQPIMEPDPPKPIKRKANYGAAILSGVGSGISAGLGAEAMGIGSDIRLKENIIKVGKALSGLNIYEWNYKSAPNSRYRGVVAHEVAKVFPEAVVRESDGLLSVIYDLIDVNMELV